MTNRVATFLRQEMILGKPLDVLDDVPAAAPAISEAAPELPQSEESLTNLLPVEVEKEAPQANRAEDYSKILEAVLGLNSRVEKLTRAIDAMQLDAKEDRFYLMQLGKDVRTTRIVFGALGALLVIAVAAVGAICVPQLDRLLSVGTEILKNRH